MIRSFQKSALSKANNYFDRGVYSCKNDERVSSKEWKQKAKI